MWVAQVGLEGAGWVPAGGECGWAVRPSRNGIGNNVARKIPLGLRNSNWEWRESAPEGEGPPVSEIGSISDLR
jgi:hypothetical protein